MFENIFPLDSRERVAARSSMKSQRPKVLWFTGLSCSGKSAIAIALEWELILLGRHTYVLDGDDFRFGISKDLGYDALDRKENIRRAGYVAKILFDAGLIVLCSFISPFRRDRQFVRSLFCKNEFYEVFVDASLQTCKSRDKKDLYRRAESGVLLDFTGISSHYETPEDPDLHLNTDSLCVKDCVVKILSNLEL